MHTISVTYIPSMFLLVRMSVEVLSRVRKKNNYKVWCETNYAHYLNMDSVKNEQSAKKIYETSNGAKSLLMAMCIGLRSSSKENQRSLGDLTLEPFSSSRQTRQFIPKKAELVKEVERRCIITLNESPRAANWSNTALTEWLMTHPVECEEEVKYLQTEEAKFHDILFEANKEAVVIARNSSGHTNGMVWNNFADMRLIHCLIVESVREAYLQRNEVLNRRQLDARNGPAATSSVEEIIANQYDDSNFGPRSTILPSLHEDFTVSHDLSLERIPCEVSPDQVKRWLDDRKAKLVLVINKWERSGNEGGGIGKKTMRCSVNVKVLFFKMMIVQIFFVVTGHRYCIFGIWLFIMTYCLTLLTFFPNLCPLRRKVYPRSHVKCEKIKSVSFMKKISFQTTLLKASDPSLE